MVNIDTKPNLWLRISQAHQDWLNETLFTKKDGELDVEQPESV